LAANVRHDNPRPLDRAFAFLDPLLARPALVIEGNHTLGRARQVGDDEADARIKFARMPLDLGDHSARPGPACGLIAEIGMEPAHIVRRSSDRPREQVADPVLQDPVSWQADRILDLLGFKKLLERSPFSLTCIPREQNSFCTLLV
jgi:hypothetical protein